MEGIMFGSRSLGTIALLSLTFVAACDDDSTGLGTSATVRVANATNSPIDVASGSAVATGNSGVAFGSSSSCVSTSALDTDLNVSPAGTTNSYASFAPNFRSGESYVVLAYPGFAGAPQFAYIPTGMTQAAGQSGLRVFNAASTAGSYDVYVTAPGAALGPVSASGIGFQTLSNYIPVAAGTSLIRLANAGTQTVTLAGSQTFTAGQNAVLVIGPPAVGSTVPRTFLVTGC
jgi:hypothetical protein